MIQQRTEAKGIVPSLKELIIYQNKCNIEKRNMRKIQNYYVQIKQIIAEALQTQVYLKWECKVTWLHLCARLVQSHSNLCHPVDCSPPGSSDIGFSRQEYWSGCHALLWGIFPTQEWNPKSLMSPALSDRFFTTSTTWEAYKITYYLEKGIKMEIFLHLYIYIYIYIYI